MSVDSVNGNNNTSLYTGIGTVTGAGAGVATGYLTKPFLKNDAPTDEFIKKIFNAAKSIAPAEARTIDENAEKTLKNLSKATSIQEFTDIMVNYFVPSNINNTENALKHLDNLIAYNAFFEMELPEEIRNANSVTDIRQFFSETLKNDFKDKSLDQLKKDIKTLETQSKKLTANIAFSYYWDSDKKKFTNYEGNELGKAIKGVAKRIQGKYAAIYGSIGAAALGIGTYLCCRGKQPKTQAQTPNNKVQS